MGRGGATKREGGACECYPYEREGEKSFSHAEGGTHKVLGFYAVTVHLYSDTFIYKCL